MVTYSGFDPQRERTCVHILVYQYLYINVLIRSFYYSGKAVTKMSYTRALRYVVLIPSNSV